MTRKVYKIDKYTWDIVDEYKSIHAAEKANNLSRWTISNGCHHRAVSKGRYVWRFVEDYEPNEDISGSNFEPCTVCDVKTGKTYIVPSSAEFARRLSLQPQIVSRAILSGALVLKRFRVRRGIGELS